MSRFLTRSEPSAFSLEQAVGYRFADPALRDLALTHVSAVSGGDPRLLSYQRLEFLGDRVLGLAVSDMIYRSFPEADEGEMSRRLADLVRAETCAAVARDWNLGEHLRFGVGERRIGLKRADSTLADACEALIGAIFLDGGFAAARGVIDAAWRARMIDRPATARDAKTMLQEWAQGRGLPAPTYRETARSGPDHAPRFVIAAEVHGYADADGEGDSKRRAERAAAEAFLRREGVWPA